MAYNFKKQLAIGQKHERFLDDFFGTRGWSISESTMDEQRLGIDRWFEVSAVAGVLAIEYKADIKASDTGNVFLETVSVGKYDDDGNYTIVKPGWVHTTTADYLMYYVPGHGDVYIFVPDDLRTFLDERGDKYRSVSVRNQGYTGRGVIVPMDDIKPVARKVLSVEDV